MTDVPTDRASQPTDLPKVMPRPYLMTALRGETGGLVSLKRWQGKALATVGLALVPLIALALLLPHGRSGHSDGAARPGGASEAFPWGGSSSSGVPNSAPGQMDLSGNSVSSPPSSSPQGTSPVSGSPTASGAPALPPDSPGQAPPQAPPGTPASPPPGSAQAPTPAAPPVAPTQVPPSGQTTKPPTSSGRTIVSHESGKCLQATAKDGSPVQIWSCDGSTKQQWSVGSDGTIRTGGFCLDPPWGATADGTALRVARCNGGSAQKFALNSAHDIVGRQSGRCVDVRDHRTANGAAVQLWGCSGTDNQKWSWR